MGLFFLSTALQARSDQTVLTDSGYTYRIDLKDVKRSFLGRYLRSQPAGTVGRALRNYLDSLGHFDQRWDTLDAKVVDIRPDRRAIVDSVTYRGCDSLWIDSLPRLDLPRFYNAGEIQALLADVGYFHACRGLPFAAIATAVDSISAGDSITPRRHLAIRLHIDPGKPALFGPPLFSAKLKTRQSQLARDVFVKSGQRFDIRRVNESEARLASRPYIAEVRAGGPAVLASADSVDSAGQLLVTVPFHVEEKSGLGLDGLLTYDSDPYRQNRLAGLFSVTLLNLFGQGESGSVDYRGEADYQRFAIRLGKTHLLDAPLSGEAGFGLEVQDRSYGFLKGELKLLTELKALWQLGCAFSGHEVTDTLRSKRRFGGLDLVLQRLPERCRAGAWGREVSLRTGSGVVDAGSEKFWRWRFDFAAGVHAPLFSRFALASRLVAQGVTTQAGDTLQVVEKFRTGGHNSLRGYAEDQFAFKTVAYLQTELLMYFGQQGSVYIFTDGGAGFSDRLGWRRAQRTDLLGYGIGIRVPVKVGTASISWARNRDDRRGLGRIHVRIQNRLAPRTPW